MSTERKYTEMATKSSTEGLRRRNVRDGAEYTSLIQKESEIDSGRLSSVENVLKALGGLAIVGGNTASAVSLSEGSSDMTPMVKIHTAIGAGFLSLFAGSMVENYKSNEQLRVRVAGLGEAITEHATALSSQGKSAEEIKEAVIDTTESTLKGLGINLPARSKQAIREAWAENTAHSAIFENLTSKYSGYLKYGTAIGLTAMLGGAIIIGAGAAIGSSAATTAGAISFGGGAALGIATTTAENKELKQEKLVISNLISAFEGETRGLTEGNSRV